MKDFTNKKWITTDENIKNLLKQCKQCFASTLNGNLVLPYNKLETLNVSKLKYTLILNTNSSDNVTGSVGHWLVYHVNVLSKLSIIHDSLNEIERCHQDVLLQIRLFCKKNNLKLIILGLVTQRKENLNCGLHSLWFTHKCHGYNSNALLKLKKVFAPYSVNERERYIMNETLSIFKI